MKKSDKERLKKIVSTWENLSRQMQQRGITPAVSYTHLTLPTILLV